MSDQIEFCCVAFRMVSELDGTICRPTYVVETDSSMELRADRWAINLYHTTPSGRISKKGKQFALLNFCPWCGADLTQEERSNKK